MSTETDSKMAAVEKGDKAEGTKRRNKPDKSSTIVEEEKNEKLESEEEEEEEERVGLLERSPIVEGKREKKKVERLTLQVTPSAKDTFSIPEGRGTKLGEIERIQYFMGKTKAEDLKSLHKILYNRPGSLATLKRNIRLFTGFSFESGSEEHKKKEEVLKKNPISVLKVICTVLDLERKGTKDEIVSKILNFLMKPKASGKSLPKPKKKRQKGGKKEHSSSGSKKKSKAATLEEILTDESSTEEEKKEKEKYSDESDAEEEVEPPKKASKKEKSTSKAVPKGKKGQNTKATNVKKADSSTAKKTPAPAKKDMGSGVKKVASIGRLAEKSDSEDSSDDEPLIKKLKKPPTDEELKETVMKLLVDANLEEVTMKQICKKVFASYPDYDLSDKKDFVKNTVKELIS
ncbi:protein DEK isoform X1 [Rhincodon typus]|uniref:protein DEK isoform X1 n=1 Tax=Rhincodon typus TaxID=259920 RepID=UPI00202FD962|nr:protein DEK isoform X1 [Rhincodon typus]